MPKLKRIFESDIAKRKKKRNAEICDTFKNLEGVGKWQKVLFIADKYGISTSAIRAILMENGVYK